MDFQEKTFRQKFPHVTLESFADALSKGMAAVVRSGIKIDDAAEFMHQLSALETRADFDKLGFDVLSSFLTDRPDVASFSHWLNSPDDRTPFDRPTMPWSDMKKQRRLPVDRAAHRCQKLDVEEAILQDKIAEAETNIAEWRNRLTLVRKDRDDYAAFARYSTFLMMLQRIGEMSHRARDLGPLLVIYQAVLRQNPDNAERLMTTLRVMATDEEFLTDVANIVMKICLLYDRKTELKLREIAALNKARAAAMEAGGPKAAEKIPNPEFDLNVVAADILSMTNFAAANSEPPDAPGAAPSSRPASPLAKSSSRASALSESSTSQHSQAQASSPSAVSEFDEQDDDEATEERIAASIGVRAGVKNARAVDAPSSLVPSLSDAFADDDDDDDDDDDVPGVRRVKNAAASADADDGNGGTDGEADGDADNDDVYGISDARTDENPSTSSDDDDLFR